MGVEDSKNLYKNIHLTPESVTEEKGKQLEDETAELREIRQGIKRTLKNVEDSASDLQEALKALRKTGS